MNDQFSKSTPWTLIHHHSESSLNDEETTVQTIIDYYEGFGISVSKCHRQLKPMPGINECRNLTITDLINSNITLSSSNYIVYFTTQNDLFAAQLIRD